MHIPLSSSKNKDQHDANCNNIPGSSLSRVAWHLRYLMMYYWPFEQPLKSPGQLGPGRKARSNTLLLPAAGTVWPWLAGYM